MLFVLCSGYSQVVIQLQVPPLGLAIKPQLWNLALMNGTRESLSVRLEVVIRDIASDQQVLTGTTRVFILPEGGVQVQVKDLLPVIYSSGTSLIPVDPNPDGFLPVGIFNICYSLIGSKKGAAEQVLAETCETFEIEPLSPPMLVMPANDDVAESTRPFFTWLPPAPFQLFHNMRFDLKLVEVFPTQSPADAVQQNIPIVSQSAIPVSSFQFPQSLPELDSSKSYAWQIVAKNGILPVANSEIWTFRVKQYGIDTTRFLSRGYYTRLRREDDASYIITGENLKFSYEHEYSDSSVNIRLTDITGAVRKTVSLEEPALKVRYGQNLINLDLTPVNVTDKHIYLLELITIKQEKWYLKFEYRKP